MSFGEANLPSSLVEAYAAKKCGIFVGAGLSQAAGLPGWSGLLSALVGRAEADHSIDARKAHEYRTLADESEKFLMLAEEMKEVLGPNFKNVIEDVFGGEKPMPTRVHKLLVSLKNNQFIITSNYDMLIEKAFAVGGIFQQGYKYYEAHALQGDLYRRKFFLLKAHGDAKTAAERIVLTGKDYRNLLYKELGYQSALQSIFTMYSIIFVGTSLRDPELNLLLNYVNAALPEGGSPHYAVMPIDEVGETERSRWRKDFNIQIVPISAEEDFVELEQFFNCLVKLDGR